MKQSIHLPGRRRLRSPKLEIKSRNKPDAAKAEAPKPTPPAPVAAPPAPEPPAPEPEVKADEGDDEEDVAWSPDMSKDELVAVAKELGIYDSIEGTGANGNVLKEDVIAALEAASEN